MAAVPTWVIHQPQLECESANRIETQSANEHWRDHCHAKQPSNPIQLLHCVPLKFIVWLKFIVLATENRNDLEKSLGRHCVVIVPQR